MMLFYEQLRIGNPPAECLRAAQENMRCFRKQDLDRLINTLGDLLKLGDKELENYVINFKYWLETDLPSIDVEKFRQPRCWAGFVLTGYGDKPIYSSGRKRKR
jgi:CHAT domain-containing protein